MMAGLQVFLSRDGFTFIPEVRNFAVYIKCSR